MLGKSVIIIFSAGVCFILMNEPVEAQAQCGYQTCNLGEEGKINIHVIPHTHDDTGWKKTVDQYYYGSRPDIVTYGVQYILDTMIDELLKDPTKRFSWAEIAFFYRWWKEIDDELKGQVKKLVNEGRLQFVLGGWCVNDEGSTHYNAVIDQHTLGLQFLKQTFGDCALPTVGWQIDTFGHTKEQANMLAWHGMDGLFFSRLDYQDKEKRLEDRRMEFVWEGSSVPGDDSGSIFTHILRDGYGPPEAMFPLVFEPIMDDPDLEDYNVPSVIAAMKNAIQIYRPNYKGNHMIFMAGEDFEYENARKNFKNTDKLMKAMEGQEVDGKTVNMFYTTPACYLAAINAANISYTKVTDDFMPMATGPQNFWSGYFSSRTGLKGYSRASNNVLQVCKQLDVLGQLQPHFDSQSRIDVLRQAVAVVQHHDAITGTEWQPVSDDYTLRMHKGTLKCQEVMSQSYEKLLPKFSSAVKLEQGFCPLLNVSYCSYTETPATAFAVTVYNPLARERNETARLPVEGSQFEVYNSAGQLVPSIVLPISNETIKIPERTDKGSRATNELVFKTVLPALGYHTYFVTKTGTGGVESPVSDMSISNEHLKLTFSGSSGLLSNIENLQSGIASQLSQNFYFYKSNSGNPTSSAYTFRPQGTTVYTTNNNATTTVYKSSVLEEVRQVFSDWSSQVIRLYQGEKCAEFEWTIGPIPAADGIRREVITRYETDFVTAKKFYTDANGRQIMQRQRDFRPTWDFVNTEASAGNYFPINAKAFLKDDSKKTQLTVITDRAHGGSSIQDGNLEIMLHRRLSGEINETGSDGNGLVLRGKNWVCFETIKNSPKVHRDVHHKTFMAPLTSIADYASNLNDYRGKYNMLWSGLTRALPDNVHLLTLMQYDPYHVLLRLEHIFEKYEDPELSQVVTVSLQGLLANVPIAGIDEMTLGGDRLLSDTRRFSWQADSKMTNGDMSSFVEPINGLEYNVKLTPMQIRTFMIRTTDDIPDTTQPQTTPTSGGKAAKQTTMVLHFGMIYLIFIAHFL